MTQKNFEIRIRRHDGKIGIYNLVGTEADAKAEVAEQKQNGYYACYVVDPGCVHITNQ